MWFARSLSETNILNSEKCAKVLIHLWYFTLPTSPTTTPTESSEFPKMWWTVDERYEVCYLTDLPLRKLFVCSNAVSMAFTILNSLKFEKLAPSQNFQIHWYGENVCIFIWIYWNIFWGQIDVNSVYSTICWWTKYCIAVSRILWKYNMK